MSGLDSVVITIEAGFNSLLLLTHLFAQPTPSAARPIATRPFPPNLGQAGSQIMKLKVYLTANIRHKSRLLCFSVAKGDMSTAVAHPTNRAATEKGSTSLYSLSSRP